MTRADLLNAIYNWCATEVPAVQWQIAFIDDAPFDLKNNPDGIGVINIVFSSDVGQDIKELTYNAGTDDFTEGVQVPKNFTFSINLYGGEAYDNAERLRSSIFFDGIIGNFNSLGMGYINSSDVRDLTALVSTKYEKRAQFDITFYVNVMYNKTIDRMVEVNVKGDFDDGRVNTDQTISI